jgi:general secretion pathway protein B
MSFILDALKKSEVERQRQDIPGLMDSRPVPPRAKFPVWAAALIALLAVNLGVLAVVLTRGGAPAGKAGGPSPAAAPATAQSPSVTAQSPSATAPSLSAATSPAGAATAPVTASQALSAPAAVAAAARNGPARSPSVPASASPDHFSPMDAAPPVYAPEIPTTQDHPSPGTERRPARAGSGGDAAIHHAARAPDPVLTDSDPFDGEVLPSINELNVAGQPALADLHLDVHVYATQPSERFVYINMRKYREGATLAEGPVLERIRRDGVVLNYQGLRFVLPRQQ